MAEQFQSTPKENDEKPQLSAPLDLSQLRRLCEQATLGPWIFDRTHKTIDASVMGPVHGCGAVISRLGGSVVDGELIAVSRTALPALLDLVERLAEVVREAVDHPALMGLHADEPDCVLCVWREKARAALSFLRRR